MDDVIEFLILDETCLATQVMKVFLAKYRIVKSRLDMRISFAWCYIYMHFLRCHGNLLISNKITREYIKDLLTKKDIKYRI